MYLASPREFEDKFDCKIPQDFASLTTEDKKEIVKKLEAKWSKKTTDSNKLFNDLANQQNDPKSILNFSRDEYYGVVSLCTNWNNKSMWQQYSDNNKGFCVGFYLEKLINTRFFDGGDLVNYVHELPKIKPGVAFSEYDKDLEKRAITRLFTKTIEWFVEEEYRLVKSFVNCNQPFQQNIQLPDSVFSEVILGIDISDNDKNEIIIECNKNRIPVFQLSDITSISLLK